ncbi:glycoside hydrolase family 72 protein, partial [Laccaria bicolor S238N-H82]
LVSLVLTALLAYNVHAISQVSRTGRYLYTADGSRFYIKGVAYQQQGIVTDTSAANPFGEPSTYIDPLADASGCARDLPYLQQLGVNTVRVYSVDSTKNHDSCMSALSGAGIYTIIDLTLPLNGSIDRSSPAWSTNLLDQYLATIDAFSKYDNVLAYNVGNEVVNGSSNTNVAPFVKAAARDIKAYLTAKKSSVLIGYAAIDGADNFRDPLANYFSCDPSNTNSGSTAIDLFGLNNYEWCGNSTFADSYTDTENNFAGYNVAAYFSEYGCVPASGARPWTEVGALLSSDMSPVWSGGIAFSYFPAASAAGQFGMVTLSSDNKTVTTSTDFTNLGTQYGAATPPNSPAKASVAAAAFPACPTQNSTFLGSTTLPATPNLAACQCLKNALSCQFTPVVSDYTVVAGQLINTACGLLGQSGGTCTDIAADGAAGTYGLVSGCDPTVKLSYVMSKYYESQNRNSQACSFAGNGTVNSHASTSASAASVASSCIASPSATFAPTAPASSSGSSSTATTTSGGGKKNGASTLVGGG